MVMYIPLHVEKRDVRLGNLSWMTLGAIIVDLKAGWAFASPVSEIGSFLVHLNTHTGWKEIHRPWTGLLLPSQPRPGCPHTGNVPEAGSQGSGGIVKLSLSCHVRDTEK